MTKEELITMLKEDYVLCLSLLRKGVAIPEQIAEEKEKLEHQYINDYVIPELMSVATSLLSELNCEICLAVKKDCNGNVSIENELGHSPAPWLAKEEIDYTPSDEGRDDAADEVAQQTEETEDRHITRGGRKKFKVILNGKEVEGEDGATILANTIRLIGFRRVAAMNIMFAKGQYNLVDRRKRPDKDQVWQRKIDDWYVYTNMQNPMKIKVLRDIAEKQGLDLKIVEEYSVQETIKTSSKPKINEEAKYYSFPIIEQARVYMQENVAESTANSYIRALDNAVRDFITEKIDSDADSIFSYTTVEDVEQVIELLNSDEEFVKENTRRHNSMTAALNQYLQFIKSKEIL